MEQVEGKILKYIKQLQIPSRRAFILAYYHNFQNISLTLTSILSTVPIQQPLCQQFLKQSKLSKQSFLQGGRFLAGKFAAVMIRILYISEPQQRMQFALKLKSKKSHMFTMYESFARLLVQKENQFDLEGTLVCLKQIKEAHNQSNGKAHKYLSLVFSEEQERRFVTAILTLDCKRQKSSPLAFFKETVSNGLKESEPLENLIFKLYNHYEEEYSSETANLISQILLVYGAICFFQTISQVQVASPDQNTKENTKEQELLVYSRTSLRALSSFKLSIEENKVEQPQKSSLKLSFKFTQRAFQKIENSKFYEMQRKIGSKVFNRVSSEFNIIINESIYCLDEKDILGSGGFGCTYAAKALQIFSVSSSQQKGKNGVTVKFKMSSMAVKILKESTKIYELKGYKVSQKREYLIHSLFRELSFYEGLKRARRALGLEVERELVGFSSLVIMQEMFKIEIINEKRENTTKTFIAFEKGRGALSQKKISEVVKSHSMRRKLLLTLFKQIFEGIYCMHYDINSLYSRFLDRYFLKQDHNETYTNKFQEITVQQRCGIYHRDIKPANIILFSDSQLNNVTDLAEFRVGIIDFGMAGIVNFETNKTKTNCGSRYYMAPEIKSGEGYAEKVDIWSVGVMLYEHFSNSRLFQEGGVQNYLEVANTLQVFKTNVQDEEVSSIVTGCLKREQRERSTALQIVQKFNLSNFNVEARLREQVLGSFCNQGEKKQVVCFETKSSMKQLPQGFLVKGQAEVELGKAEARQFYKFQLRQFKDRELLNFEMQLNTLLAVLAGLTLKAEQSTVFTKSPIDTILAAEVLTVAENLVFVKFPEPKMQGQTTQQPQPLNCLHKLTSRLSIVQFKEKSSQDQTKAGMSYKVIISQKQRRLISDQSQFYEGYGFTLDLQRKTVSFETSLFKKDNDSFQQVSQPGLFLSNRGFEEAFLQRYSSSNMYWFTPQQNNYNQSECLKLLEKNIQICKLLSQRCDKVSIYEGPWQSFNRKQQLKHDFKAKIPKIVYLGKIERRQQEAVILVDSSAYFKLGKIWYKQNSKHFFSEQFKKKVKQLMDVIRRIYKMQFRLAFQTSLLYYAQNSGHYQALQEFLAPFAQHPAFFIANLNAIVTELFKSAYQSEKAEKTDRTLLRKLFKTFRGHLQSVGSLIFKQMEKKFALNGAKLQQEYFSYRTSLGKGYDARQELQKMVGGCKELIRLHGQGLEPLRVVLQNYKYLFLFIDVFGCMIDSNAPFGTSRLSIFSLFAHDDPHHLTRTR